MQQDDYIIDRLGVSHYSDEQKELVLEQVRMFIGEAMSKSLSEQQLNEYQAIIDDNEAVITAWLDQNVPEYKNSTLYKVLIEAYQTDPEHNRPEKTLANLAWVEKNVPNAKELADKVIDDYKANQLATS